MRKIIIQNTKKSSPGEVKIFNKVFTELNQKYMIKLKIEKLKKAIFAMLNKPDLSNKEKIADFGIIKTEFIMVNNLDKNVFSTVVDDIFNECLSSRQF